MKYLLILLSVIVTSSCFGLNPSKKYAKTPSSSNLKFDEVKVSISDAHVSLNAWIIYPSNPSNKVLLISHNGEGNMSNYIERYKTFIQIGYTVVAYDYRGYGTSSSFNMDNNMFIYPHFINDIQAMISYCLKMNNGKPIDLYGWGIGAGLSLGAGWNASGVHRIIADTPFLSMEDLEERFADWDEPYEVPYYGFNSKYEPINSIKSDFKGSKKEVLILIGSNDVLFTKSDMTQFSDARSSNFQIQEIQNPDRYENYDADKVTYSIYTTQFLNK